MRYLFLFFSLLTPILSNADSIKKFAQEEIEKANLNQYIEEFPFEEYKIYTVPKIGDFYIDDISDSIKDWLRKGIAWERNIAVLIKKYTKPGTTVIDLGAHIGTHTLIMSRKIGSKGKVIAFEPQWKIFRELYHNMHLNHCDHNVIMIPCAVGEEDKMVEMKLSTGSNEGGIPVGSGGNPAHMITLDSLELKNISLIKMDIEGYELKALQGARKTILRNKPVIILEILGGTDFDKPLTPDHQILYDQTIQLLRELGYQISRIANHDFLAMPK